MKHSTLETLATLKYSPLLSRTSGLLWQVLHPGERPWSYPSLYRIKGGRGGGQEGGYKIHKLKIEDISIGGSVGGRG